MAQMTMSQLHQEWKGGDADGIIISTNEGHSYIDDVFVRPEGDGEFEVVVVLADLPDIVGTPDAEIDFERTP